MKTEILGGRVIDPAQQLDRQCNLYIDNGRIAAIGEAPAGFQAERSLSADGLVVCPGLVDLHAHLREPGYTQKGTIATESRAAAAGGITTLCCPPQTQPVLDTTAVARLVLDKATEQGRVRVLPLGALTQGLLGEHLSNMHALTEAGCVALSNARRPIRNTQTLVRCLEYAATHDLLIFFQPEDPDLSTQGCAHDGPTASRMGLQGIPESAETIALARDLLLVEETGARAHFGQLSSARAVTMVQEARQRGLRVSADVSIYHLLLTDRALEGFNSDYHLQPPLRSELDRQGLRDALASGAIQAICSDHQPHEAAAKAAPFPATEPGISGLETLLPLALRLVQEQVVSLPELIRVLTQGPAEVLGQPLGSLKPGTSADLCIFDPNAVWTPQAAHWHSRGLNSPYLGQALTGQVRYTLLEGEVVYQVS